MTSVRKKTSSEIFARRVGCEVRQVSAVDNKSRGGFDLPRHA